MYLYTTNLTSPTCITSILFHFRVKAYVHMRYFANGIFARYLAMEPLVEGDEQLDWPNSQT